MKERVQKLLAQANLGSRRACEELIRQGRVSVNGQVIQLGAKADPETDTVVVDGVKLSIAGQQKIYIAFNKPINVLSTDVPHRRDDRKTVRELIPVEGHLFTVGRLDAESNGLMLLTNDGEMANRLTHPRYGHTKTYRVVVYGMPSAEAIQKWETGVYLDDGKTAPCSVRVLEHSGGLTTLRVVMKEGKKRQIRRVASLLGYPVRWLTRTHIGRLALGDLKPGEWRELTRSEIEAMQTPVSEHAEIRQRRSRPRAEQRRAADRPRRRAREQRPGQRPRAKRGRR